MNLFIVTLLAAIFAGAIGSAESARREDASKATRTLSPVEMTWAGASVYVPAGGADNHTSCEGTMGESNVQSCFEGAKLPKSKLIVIYLHGCDGMNASGLELLRRLGQMYVAPNSFQRPGRSADCAVSSDKKGIVRMRLEETDYAIEKIRANPNLKDARIVIMGFSEGAVTAALHRAKGEIGKIIIGWSCHSADPWFDGIRGDINIPVAAIEGSNDHYTQNSSNRGNCGTFIPTATSSFSLILKGREHQVMREAETYEALTRYFKELDSEALGSPRLPMRNSAQKHSR